MFNFFKGRKRKENLNGADSIRLDAIIESVKMTALDEIPINLKFKDLIIGFSPGLDNFSVCKADETEQASFKDARSAIDFALSYIEAKGKEN